MNTSCTHIYANIIPHHWIELRPTTILPIVSILLNTYIFKILFWGRDSQRWKCVFVLTHININLSCKIITYFTIFSIFSILWFKSVEKGPKTLLLKKVGYKCYNRYITSLNIPQECQWCLCQFPRELLTHILPYVWFTMYIQSFYNCLFCTNKTIINNMNHCDISE